MHSHAFALIALQAANIPLAGRHGAAAAAAGARGAANGGGRTDGNAPASGVTWRIFTAATACSRTAVVICN